MASEYDIFKKDLHGSPVWVEAAPSLQAAKLRVIELHKKAPGEYVIFCHVTQKLISATPAFS
jgi:hypothetical protein